MDFTREPTIETIITPREGCKIVVRNSKAQSNEEYFVDAVEVVSFGRSVFFRCLEKPKPFLLPATDYEVLEVREARVMLKSVGFEKNIKIAGGKKETPAEEKQEKQEKQEEQPKEPKKKERPKSRRRKQRGRVEETVEEGSPKEEGEEVVAPSQPPRTLLPPPSTLISETLARYRERDDFKGAFYTNDEQPMQETEDTDAYFSQKFDEALEAPVEEYQEPSDPPSEQHEESESTLT